MNSVINRTDGSVFCRYVTILKNISEELNVSQKQNEKSLPNTFRCVIFVINSGLKRCSSPLGCFGG